MKIAVLLKQVPDIVEELQIAPEGTDLLRDDLKYRLNEFDDYALEEALQLKAIAGGRVTCLALDTGAADELLATCLARGADRVIKVGSYPPGTSSHTAARAFAEALREVPYDLLLTGVQAIDDLDGQVGPLVATALDLPHVSVVTHIAVAGDGRTASVSQEYAGGVVAEFEVDLPAVLGVQTSREAPRYAPVSRVRQLMKTAAIESLDVAANGGSGLVVEEIAIPEATSAAEMIEGGVDEIAERLAALIRDRGLVPGSVR